MSVNEGVSGDDTPGAARAPLPHPLARELASSLPRGNSTRILLLGVGSGRSVPTLLQAATRLEIIEEEPQRARAAAKSYANEPRIRVARVRYAGPYPFAAGFAGALATHALLHGSVAAIGAAIAAVRNRLAANAPFYFTLGSQRDPRFATGRRVDAATVVMETGSEAGVPHVYFDEEAVRALTDGFSLQDLREVNAAESVGRWAHAPEEAAAIVHWFVRARRSR